MKEIQSSKRKLLTEEIHKIGRTQSVVGYRSSVINSPSIESKKVSRDISKMMSPRLSIDQSHLPPISGRRNVKEPSSRLQKIGMEILDAPRRYNNK